MKYAFVYITTSNEKEARKIAKQLLEKRLIACANIFPVESWYHWRGKIAKDKEFILVAKTANAKYRELVEEVKKVHSYSVPCIAKIPVTFNGKYAEWVGQVLGAG